jgi:hypothetical protein
MLVYVKNEKAVANLLRTLPRRISSATPTLFRTMGGLLVRDVRARLSSGDGGKWAPPSKWVKAKRNARKVLVGLGGRIKQRVVGRSLHVYFDSPGPWTLTQHHQGFVTPPTGERVSFRLKRPSALGLPSSRTSFSFISRRESPTPARKIWPNTAEVVTMIEPTIVPWFNRLLLRIPGVEAAS